MAPIKTGVNGVREALKPLFILASICGLQMFEYRVLSWNYIQYVLLWTCYWTSFAGLWILTDFNQLHSFLATQLITAFNTITCMLVTALTLVHKKKFQNCLEGISLINTTLEEINIPNEYSNLRMSAWKMIGIWCLMAVDNIIERGASMFKMYGKYMVSAIFVKKYTTLTNFFTFIIICIVQRYIGSRFDWINKYIGERIKDGEYKTKLPDKGGVNDLWNPVVEKKQERDIWMIMLLHNNLCKISRELNALFGLAILLQIGVYFAYVCAVVILMCILKQENIKCYIIIICVPRRMTFGILRVWATAAVCIAKTIYFNHVCESVSAKANSTKTLLHVFLNSLNEAQSRRELSQFIMHIVHRPLKFDGAGMFYFGYGFVYTFFGALSTVTVIIMQSSYYGVLTKDNNTLANSA